MASIENISIEVNQAVAEECKRLVDENARLRTALHNAERELVRLFTVLPIKGHLPSPSIMQECQVALLANTKAEPRAQRE